MYRVTYLPTMVVDAATSHVLLPYDDPDFFLDEFHNLGLDVYSVHSLKKLTATCHNNATESYYFVLNQI